jgi:thiol-disulfide isomerase/thioredoxin
MKIIFVSFLCLISIICGAKNNKLKPGKWHTEFQLNDKQNLPVNFNLKLNKRQYILEIINADERIALKDIKRENDSIYIKFPMFDSELKGKIINSKQVSGYWYNYVKGPSYKIKFTALYSNSPRFKTQISHIDVDGKWEVIFNYNSEREKAIGIFKRENLNAQKVTGTFLTETGDYRYLEGAISKDSLYLSTFDGSHAFLFKSQLRNDTLWGEFFSGTHYKTNWYAVKNPLVKIGNPDSLTYLINQSPIEFDLVDLENQSYHYPNSSTENKVTLIQIMGTWCPNCLDESRYLAVQKEKYKEQLEVIAITFETPPTLEDKIKTVHKYKDALQLDFKFLIGGDACKDCAANLFPMLNSIISFPTLIVIDKQSTIRKIHTGFNGPGTGNYYLKFENEMNAFISKLVQE